MIKSNDFGFNHIFINSFSNCSNNKKNMMIEIRN